MQLEVETLKAKKQAELANMEQRFARHGRQRDTAMDMDTDNPPTSTQQQAKTPQKPPNTPSLDAIKRIKRGRGTTRRTRLVSVADVSTRRGQNWFSTDAIAGRRPYRNASASRTIIHGRARTAAIRRSDPYVCDGECDLQRRRGGTQTHLHQQGYSDEAESSKEK